MKPSVGEAAAAISEVGYVVLEDVAPLSLFDEVEAVLRPILDETMTGRDDFEGLHTKRASNLLAKHRVFWDVAGNEDVLALAQAVLGPHFQVSIIQAIEILPGETPQAFHTDDALYPFSHPHAPVVFNTMWAIDDFTDANGGTRLVPGSHHWEDPIAALGDDLDSVAAEMPRGGVLAWVGNLIHGGGANTTDAPRLGITMNYNQAWLRQQENQYVGIPLETVQEMPERLQRIIGYDIHPPFIGNLEGRNPMKTILGRG